MNLRKTSPPVESTGGFFFLGNQLTLDLLNTRPAPAGESVELLPDFGALLRWLREAGLLETRASATLKKNWGDSARARRVVQEIREFRERLRKQVLAWERGAVVDRSMLEELNRRLAAYPMRTRLKAIAGAPAAELWFQARKPEDLFAPLAHSAVGLFTEVDRSRVRKCGHCVAHFRDTSKKGTRRWCSMQVCGNRLKVAAYAARHRGHAV